MRDAVEGVLSRIAFMTPRGGGLGAWENFLIHALRDVPVRALQFEGGSWKVGKVSQVLGIWA